MKILWLTWKDDGHPGAGGAEVVLRELSQRLAAEGHEVTWLTCGYGQAPGREQRGGIEIIRVGTNRYAHSMQALVHYVRHLRGQFDIVIEVVNTAPYFSVFFGKGSRRYLFYHQLAREIWFHEAPAPVSHVGYYLLEPLATRLLARSKAPLITVSDSTRRDLQRYGFRPETSHIISQGIEIKPVPDLAAVKKYDKLTLLSLGAMRAMKRTLDQIEAFELAKARLPQLRLKIAGSSDGAYGKQVKDRITASKYAEDIDYLGRVTIGEKMELMQKSHVIMQTSLKEGWGLTITEAASQGTPAVAYDVDGLRDSIRHDRTGLLTPPNPQALADAITALLRNPAAYRRLRQAAWEWSREITFDNSYRDFKKAVEIV